MELAFASLHQLCAPFLDRLDQLPAPQHDALATTFGLRAGNPPDRFVVGLAVLTLLCDAAEAQPLVCLIDDAQWLDQASAQTLEFVARRLRAERVVMAFAVRTSDQLPKLTGLPELVLSGIASPDAAALLESAVAGRLDDRVRSRVLAEARGNPLALLELPRQLSYTELAFGTAPRQAEAHHPHQPPGGSVPASAARPPRAVPPTAATRGCRSGRRYRPAASGRPAGRHRGRGAGGADTAG